MTHPLAPQLSRSQFNLIASNLLRLRYFSFTKSNTKIAHTPTVIGNCTKDASRIAPPLGRKNVASIMARAVSTPRISLLFQFMRVSRFLVCHFKKRLRLYTLIASDTVFWV